ncbi:hypothetical protein STEG23_005687 [Scotinomys teguina]
MSGTRREEETGKKKAERCQPAVQRKRCNGTQVEFFKQGKWKKVNMEFTLGEQNWEDQCIRQRAGDIMRKFLFILHTNHKSSSCSIPLFSPNPPPFPPPKRHEYSVFMHARESFRSHFNLVSCHITEDVDQL